MTTEELILSTLQAMQAQNVTIMEIIREVGEVLIGTVLGGFMALVILKAIDRLWA